MNQRYINQLFFDLVVEQFLIMIEMTIIAINNHLSSRM